MSHWTAVAVTYVLTFVALAVEVTLLVRRRRAALRQLWLAQAAEPGGSEETDDPDIGNRAGT